MRFETGESFTIAIFSNERSRGGEGIESSRTQANLDGSIELRPQVRVVTAHQPNIPLRLRCQSIASRQTRVAGARRLCQKGLFPFTGAIELGTFAFGAHAERAAWGVSNWRLGWTDPRQWPFVQFASTARPPASDPLKMGLAASSEMDDRP
jgi:hypothetical protein